MVKKVSGTVALAALILNMLIPGLGTLVAGETTVGTIQFVLFIAGILLAILVIGIAFIAGAWIWALITSISLVKKA
jgi:TM2 domain-containing membrane protein YozV